MENVRIIQIKIFKNEYHKISDRPAPPVKCDVIWERPLIKLNYFVDAGFFRIYRGFYVLAITYDLPEEKIDRFFI